MARFGVVCDARLDAVARADSDDDTLRRFIVRHYRYDPERRERRHVVVAAFDSRREFTACMAKASEQIERRRSAGEHVDPGEHVSGVVHEPGYGRRAANGRLVIRAISHGVAPGPWLDNLEMPPNVAVLRSQPQPGQPPRASLERLLRRWHASGRHRWFR